MTVVSKALEVETDEIKDVVEDLIEKSLCRT